MKSSRGKTCLIAIDNAVYSDSAVDNAMPDSNLLTHDIANPSKQDYKTTT